MKDVVELVMCTRFTVESLHYLDFKLSEHRTSLQQAFPHYGLRPKHHYLEYYPHLIQVFVPLVDVWTMRFEGKHKFFKQVIRGAHNFRNVLLTLADRQQKMIAYHSDSASFF